MQEVPLKKGDPSSSIPLMLRSPKLQTANPREFAIDMGYAMKLSGRFSAAVALRYIYSNLATGAADGVSYKVGFDHIV